MGCFTVHDEDTFISGLLLTKGSFIRQENIIIMETIKVIVPPVLIGCIILEAYLSAREHRGLYERKDTITSLSVAAINVVLNVLIKGSVYLVYSTIQEYSLFKIEEGLISWIVLFLLTDFQSYLFHYLGHKSRFFWAMHSIHHTSHKYNFATAIRTPLTNSGFRFATLAPLILLGFSPTMVLTMDALILIYAFFQHTELIKKLGWVEYVFNTPSHHRVHHASDEKYLDKNFGGVLIIWDKLFGTFKEEEEHPVYGLAKPLPTNTLFYVIFHEWIEIIKDLRKTPVGLNAVKLLFAAPGWSGSVCSAQPEQPKIGLAKFVYVVIAVLILVSLNSHAQVERQFLLLGIDAEKKHDERSALIYYKKAIQHDNDCTEALIRCSRVLCTLAGREYDKLRKFQKADSAHMYAMHAIDLDPNHIEARLNYIISLGMLSQASNNPSEKFRNAMRIREEAEVLITLDSLSGPAYYILGKWHYEVSRLTWIEKLACKALFGGIPKDVSLDQSLRYYDKAIRLKPDYILFHYGKANALYEGSQYNAAIEVLQHALKLPCIEPDDKIRKSQCQQLLDEAKKNVRSKNI